MFAPETPERIEMVQADQRTYNVDPGQVSSAVVQALEAGNLTVTHWDPDSWRFSVAAGQMGEPYHEQFEVVIASVPVQAPDQVPGSAGTTVQMVSRGMAVDEAMTHQIITYFFGLLDNHCSALISQQAPSERVPRTVLPSHRSSAPPSTGTGARGRPDTREPVLYAAANGALCLGAIYIIILNPNDVPDTYTTEMVIFMLLMAALLFVGAGLVKMGLYRLGAMAMALGGGITLILAFGILGLKAASMAMDLHRTRHQYG